MNFLKVLFCFCVITTTLQSINAKGQKNEIINHEVAIIVRIPTYNAKIKHLESQIETIGASNKKKNELRKLLKETEQRRDNYFSLISASFKNYYRASAIYFVPDTLYKNLLKGETRVFINDENKITDISLENKYVMHMIQGKDEYQLLLTDKDHHVLPYPWPHKKGTFLAAIKKMIDKKSYMVSQVKWFDYSVEKAIKLNKN